MSTFGIKGAELGMLAPVPEALLKARPFELMGDLRVSWSDWKLVVEFESPGNSFPTTLGALGFLEKRPIAALLKKPLSVSGFTIFNYCCLRVVCGNCSEAARCALIRRRLRRYNKY